MDIQARLEYLYRTHKDLHDRIEALYAENAPEIYINKLKIKKLSIKDEIERLTHV